MKRIVWITILCGLLFCLTRTSVASGQEQANDQILSEVIAGLKKQEQEVASEFVKGRLAMVRSLVEVVKNDAQSTANFLSKVGSANAYVIEVVRDAQKA